MVNVFANHSESLLDFPCHRLPDDTFAEESRLEDDLSTESLLHLFLNFEKGRLLHLLLCGFVTYINNIYEMGLVLILTHFFVGGDALAFSVDGQGGQLEVHGADVLVEDGSLFTVDLGEHGVDLFGVEAGDALQDTVVGFIHDLFVGTSTGRV